MSQSVLGSSITQRQTQESECRRGHPFRVSGYFSFNLSSRIGPITLYCCRRSSREVFLLDWGSISIVWERKIKRKGEENEDTLCWKICLSFRGQSPVCLLVCFLVVCMNTMEILVKYIDEAIFLAFRVKTIGFMKIEIVTSRLLSK